MDKAELQAKRAEQLPITTQFALRVSLPNIAYGASWGFVDTDEVEERYETLRKDRNILVRKIQGGCLVEVNPEYIIKAASVVDKTLVTNQDVDNMKKMIAEGYASFDKFLSSKRKKEPNFEGVISIYCTNKVTAVTHKGISCPAFRVGYQNALGLLQQYGFGVAIKGSGYLPAGTVLSNADALFKSMLMSPTKTGALIKVKAL